jgi:hypothetical protein
MRIEAPMHSARKFIKVVLLAAISATGCSNYNNYLASRPANVMQIEARLEQSEFRKVPIETSNQHSAVAELPLHQLNRYQSTKGSVFWYADPTVCKCLYEGDQEAYDRYALLLEQEHEVALSVRNQQPEEVADLSEFSYAFPPPLIFGSWSAVPPPGGGVHSTGASGRGAVMSRSAEYGGSGISGYGSSAGVTEYGGAGISLRGFGGGGGNGGISPRH